MGWRTPLLEWHIAWLPIATVTTAAGFAAFAVTGNRLLVEFGIIASNSSLSNLDEPTSYSRVSLNLYNIVFENNKEYICNSIENGPDKTHFIASKYQISCIDKDLDDSLQIVVPNIDALVIDISM